MTMRISRNNTGKIRPLHPGGFSLIELILVLTIISVLAAIAVPRYAGALARYRADAAARRIIADLNYARSIARATSTGVEVQFKNSQDYMSMDSVKSLDNPAERWVLALADKPYYADLVSNDFPSSKLIFDGYGDPDSGGSIKLSVGTEARTVVLDINTGKAVMQ